MDNDKHLNPHCIEIRPYIKTTFDEITNYIGLFDKGEYLAELKKLKIKYKMR